MRNALALLFLFGPSLLLAQMPPIGAWEELGGQAFSHWSGLEAKEGVAQTKAAGEAVFRYPDGPKGSYNHGFRRENDSAQDWRGFYGIQFDVKLDQAAVGLLQARFVPYGVPVDQGSTASIVLAGDGWHTVTLPWDAFSFNQVRTGLLQSVKEFHLRVTTADGKDTETFALKNVRLIKGAVLALSTPIAGKATVANGRVDYEVTVSNCTDQPQAVALAMVRHGWEAMAARVEPATLNLAPGESQPCRVSVQIPGNIPPGGHEQEQLQAIANGQAANAATLDFVTAVQVPHPYIMHTRAGWDEVREKVKKYAWAKEQQNNLLKTAQDWTVPQIAQPPVNDPNDNSGPFVFATTNENGLMANAAAWQLTGDRKYAEKVALFLKRLSDPAAGYPKTLRACNQSLVQEGHFFQHNAMAYDMILDSGVLSEADQAQIEQTFRLLLHTIDLSNRDGAINNWNLSEVTGAFYCSLVMGDLAQADRFFTGPGGIQDQLAKGTMDDGWWYECTISYNMWCASELTQAALALEPWGVNFKDAWVPASYFPTAALTTTLSGGKAMDKRPFGMTNEIWGPIRRPYRRIQDLWNSMLPFIDYRGVMFGVNDSTENKVSGNRTEVFGQPLELAYYAYRDPAYATLIKNGGNSRDLIYGVPELPEKTPELYRTSAYADNAGIVMLRSQAEQRPIREQIQAVLHYGSHGWAHGHYDRTDLLSLMRYGRSFWNPESVFYVYEPFFYKFYTQTSENHNMVVVDQKMQEPDPGQRLLFSTGKMMQATAVQTTARWSYPPYGGMVYDYVPVKTFAEKTWREGRSVPIPANPPAYGTLTGYTEPVLQRRLMLVTDDYVVIADYLKGEKEHTFDSLLQLKGFEGIDAATKQFVRHDGQWNTDPLGSGQFVTDCDWYHVQAPAVAHFTERWGPGADNEGSRSIANENGVLKLNVHSLWPQAQDLMVAAAPEFFHVEKKLYYTVSGDGKTLADGKFGAWILGTAEIDVPVTGVKQLQLQTKVEESKLPTVFWASARVVTKSGAEIPLSKLPVKFINVLQPKEAGKDYAGGPVKIVGVEQKSVTPGQPQDEKQPGLVQVDLSGVDAVRFKTTLGGDYPLGDETQRRKIYAVRSQGKEARFLTLIEPFESHSVVKSARATSADQLRVELTDGRVQEITLHEFAGDGKSIQATIRETKDGQLLREEETSNLVQ